MKVNPKGRHVLVLGHADGDGHLAAEQSRANLTKAGALNCRVVVDPRLTRNYRFWEKTFASLDLGDADFVVFVDLMFNPYTPRQSFEVLADRAALERDRFFVVIDHHPIDALPRPPANVHLAFTPAVCLCCYGLPSDLMIIAAICGRDEDAIKYLITPLHRKRASGVKRAAADVSGLAGKPLLTLLRNRRWDLLEGLADDSAEAHRNVRGVRLTTAPLSPALAAARTAAKSREAV